MHVLITGANRGIGARLASAYAARGDRVTATARNAADCVPLDVTDPASVTALAGKLGDVPVDLLVCNAGVYLDKGRAFGDLPAEIWAQSFAVNVTGVYLTVEAFLPNLERAQAPKITILSSIMASSQRAPGGSYVYRASKAAALNLGRNLATDLRGRVSVGIYHPGWVRTDMGGAGADIDPEEAVAGLMARFDALGPATTGVFESYDGTPIPF